MDRVPAKLGRTWLRGMSSIGIKTALPLGQRLRASAQLALKPYCFHSSFVHDHYLEN